MVHQTEWHPTDWKSKPILQDVIYEDQAHVDRVLTKLSHLPPMVSPREIETLREHLKNVALGKAFLLQGGDCAELFDYCSQDPIDSKLQVLSKMSDIITCGTHTPVVCIARIAGQYGKPRSNPMEMYNGQQIHSFRGDNVNGYAPTDRKPDPERLLGAYFHSAATLNYIRSSKDFDLHASEKSIESIKHADVYTSHEALFLDYETSLTRLLTSPSTGRKKWYNAGAHFLWIGDRTRQPDGGHVEYMKGIENPIGIKVGPTTVPEQLVTLLNTVNPNKEIGKVTLITRFGADSVEKYLPQHIQAVRNSGHVPVWVCDPMHGNTKTAAGNLKTRHLSDIVKEVTHTFRVHQECSSKLNGVHFELTGEDVTECIGGTANVEESDLSTNYKTYCDPRLNYKQSIDAAIATAQLYENEKRFRYLSFFKKIFSV